MKKISHTLFKLIILFSFFISLQSCFGNEYSHSNLDEFDLDVLHIIRDASKPDSTLKDTILIELDTIISNEKCID
tara:strand:- start:425 stop:649 length:225 start_codon:yes stop_codon:yes gene_type:complete